MSETEAAADAVEEEEFDADGESEDEKFGVDLAEEFDLEPTKKRRQRLRSKAATLRRTWRICLASHSFTRTNKARVPGQQPIYFNHRNDTPQLEYARLLELLAPRLAVDA